MDSGGCCVWGSLARHASSGSYTRTCASVWTPNSPRLWGHFEMYTTVYYSKPQYTTVDHSILQYIVLIYHDSISWQYTRQYIMSQLVHHVKYIMSICHMTVYYSILRWNFPQFFLAGWPWDTFWLPAGGRTIHHWVVFQSLHPPLPRSLVLSCQVCPRMPPMVSGTRIWLHNTSSLKHRHSVLDLVLQNSKTENLENWEKIASILHVADSSWLCDRRPLLYCHNSIYNILLVIDVKP